MAKNVSVWSRFGGVTEVLEKEGGEKLLDV